LECFRCGRLTENGGNLCWKCNSDWNKYMKAHPLKTYSYPESKTESDKRWNGFLNEKEKVNFT